MGRNVKMPWSMEDTVENMEYIRSLMINQVRMVNLDNKGEEDVKEIHYDFNRVEEALKKQIPKKVNEVYQARTGDIPGMCISAGNCPVCGASVPKKHWYCWSCGQRLAWPSNIENADNETAEYGLMPAT